METCLTVSPFRQPFKLVEHSESFEIASANGEDLAFVYFEDEPDCRPVRSASRARTPGASRRQSDACPSYWTLRRLRGGKDETA
jgi:hypothetical protein